MSWAMIKEKDKGELKNALGSTSTTMISFSIKSASKFANKRTSLHLTCFLM